MDKVDLCTTQSHLRYDNVLDPVVHSGTVPLLRLLLLLLSLLQKQHRKSPKRYHKAHMCVKTIHLEMDKYPCYLTHWVRKLYACCIQGITATVRKLSYVATIASSHAAENDSAALSEAAVAEGQGSPVFVVG